MPDSVITEALARIEHKQDIILRALRKQNPQMVIPKVGEFAHACPVCDRQVEHIVDIMKKVIVRKCGCTTGKQAPINLEAYAPPVMGKGDSNGTGRGSEAEQDGGDAGGSGRRNKRR